MTLEDLLDAWRINNAVTLELLALCPDEAFECKPGKGKTIRSNFVHLVGVRRMWIEAKSAQAARVVPKLDWKAASREEIVAGLGLTHDLMAEVFTKMEAATKPTRWTTLTYFAYCIAHESHHRSQVEISLRLNGFEPSDDILYGLWDWPKK